MSKRIAIIALSVSLAFTGSGWTQRSSASYRVESEAVTAGVSDATSPTYEGTSGAGLPDPTEQTSPEYQTTPELTGQLSVPLGFALAGPLTVNEGDSGQFYPSIALDDGTFQSLGLEGATFTLISSTSFAQLSEGGLLTTLPFPQNQTLTLQVNQGAGEATRSVTLKDTLKDNFGVYAGDGLDDTWQFTYFGLADAHGVASADPDADGFTNFYEYLTGSSPLDRRSGFRLLPTQQTEEMLSFTLPQVLAGRRYRIQRSPTLTPPWTDVQVIDPLSDVADYVIHLPPEGPSAFYRVSVELKP